MKAITGGAGDTTHMCMGLPVLLRRKQPNPDRNIDK